MAAAQGTRAAVVWQEGFEGAVSGWTVEGGTWEFGAPTSGPGAAFAGQNVAATVLAGNYTSGRDARLATPAFDVPAAGDYPRLKFVFWAQINSGDFTQLQVRTAGGSWQDLPGNRIGRTASGSWSQQVLDLRPWAGQSVQVGFRFVSDGFSTVGPGCYLDEVALVTGAPEFPQPGGFESAQTDWGDWSAEGDAWQFGAPTAAGGPQPFSGSNVAGTVLGANYGASMDGRLVSPEFLVPAADQQPRFKYAFWSFLGGGDFGQLQVRVSGGEWQDVADNRTGPSSAGEWSQSVLDLRPWAGQQVQVGFRFTSDGFSTVAPGWFIDDAQLETGTPAFPQPTDFEDRQWGDWSAEGGVWQFGAPTATGGPQPFSGQNVAGTVLGGNYSANMDGRLASPEFLVPPASEQPRLKYATWYLFNGGDFGQVQVRVNGGAWEDVAGHRFGANSAGEWSQSVLDLRPWAGQQVQVGFRFTSDGFSTVAPGWFIDDAQLETGTPFFPNPTGWEDTWGDWSAEGGVWQFGAPTATGGPQPFSGQNVAGTVLGGNYSASMNARLVSPEFIVPVASAHPQLSFWHWRTLGNGDRTTVEVRVGSGEWTDLGLGVAVGTPVNGWSNQSIDLTPYAGQAVRIAFHFTSDGFSSVGPGWFVDDIEVVSDTLDPIADQVIPESAEFRLLLGSRGTDLRFNFQGPAPAGAMVGPTASEFVWTPAEDQGPGLYTNLTVWVTQPNNSLTPIDAQSFDVTVNEINVAPSIEVTGAPTIEEGATLALAVAVTDPDLPVNTLTLQLVSGPPGLTLDAQTGAIAWATEEATGPGEYTVELRATDHNPDAANEQQLSTTHTVTVVVREVNTPPLLIVPGNQVIDELTPWNVSVSATDADLPANALTFALVSPPAGMTIDPATGALAWTPTEAQGPGQYDITVRVTDTSPRAVNEPQLSDTKTFSVTVNEVNVAPVLTLPASQTIDELTPLNVTTTATDPDVPANQLTFSLVEAPEGLSIDAATGALTWTPTEAQGPGSFTVTVRVEDNGAPARSDTQSFTVTVNEVNQAPVLEVIADQSVHYGFALSVQAAASDADLPANRLAFSLDAAPGGLTIDGATGAISWTPEPAQVGNHTVTVRVADNGTPSLSATRTFQLTVTGEGSSLAISRVGTLAQLNITGDIGLRYELQWSTDLVQWNRLTDFTLANSPFLFIDPDSAAQVQRFYRLRLIEP